MFEFEIVFRAARASRLPLAALTLGLPLSPDSANRDSGFGVSFVMPHPAACIVVVQSCGRYAVRSLCGRAAVWSCGRCIPSRFPRYGDNPPGWDIFPTSGENKQYLGRSIWSFPAWGKIKDMWERISSVRARSQRYFPRLAAFPVCWENFPTTQENPKKVGQHQTMCPTRLPKNNVIRYICSLVSRLFAMINISSTAFAGERILTSPPNWKTHA